MALAEAPTDPGADYGEVFTRQWVVDLVLDLVGYTPDQDLADMVLVEPSCGTGAFLVPIADRLIESCVRHGRDLTAVAGAVRAFDVLEANAARARKVVADRFHSAGMSGSSAESVARSWVTTGDFLLSDHELGPCDYVVGNPPYIRLESVPSAVMERYRRSCPTMRGRSDIYVGFFERGLGLLKPGGALGFICADRWMRNQYGASLRELITQSFAVEAVLTMHDVDAFENEVSAYPAVVVLRNATQGQAVVADTNARFGARDARRVARWASRGAKQRLQTPTVEASAVERWFTGRDLWPVGTPAQLALIAELEARSPLLEESAGGTRVGIGVATGCDDVFITTDPELVEPDRLLPLLRPADTVSGVPDWSGAFLVNPWDEGGLVDLGRYPRLSEYFFANDARLTARHVARKRPTQWYRTIDRVDLGLLRRPKLVLPDLKASAHPVLDDGGFYPHHNLYFVVSDEWDPEVLGGLLLSDVTNLFVGAYCVKMRGGCYRFQAQYLRRIRLPHVEAVTRVAAKELTRAFRDRDARSATSVALDLYGVDSSLATICDRRGGTSLVR